ncbi:MAG: Mur ligase family protein [Candidatus Omnitrophica bacterium]|nr:Mur ligase family protein [Candidatus Omnitrophota bacterium]
MDIEKIKKVCIVGFGKSGISLCNLLLSLGKKVVVSEIKDENNFNLNLVKKFEKKGVCFEFGVHTENFIKDIDLLILSPSVNIKNSIITEMANKLGIPYVGEIEFSFWLTKAKFIAITGSSGKTTTTFLTYQVLKNNLKQRIFLGGNIGIPVSSFILNTKKDDIIVLEVSSFQLQTILYFRPFVAVLLNLEPNHLDHHSCFEEYFLAKMNIFKNQNHNDWAVLDKNMSLLGKVKKYVKAKKIYFSSEFLNKNFSCVYRIGSIFGLDKFSCQKVFSNFKGLPHRLQLVRVIRGIKFINDSKATTTLATIWALKNTKGKVILISGGKDKGVDYSQILSYKEQIKKINLIGEAALKIKEVLEPSIKSEIFSSLEDAVLNSYKEAENGDSVIFSPMCSSFDMFKNYKDRGQKFIHIVNSLK